MIRVAIWDDDYGDLHYLQEIVAGYGARMELRLSVNTFGQPKDLENQLLQGSSYQIYILDMLMPQIDGIEIGQAIRRQDAHATIIYLTSTMDFAYQAFGVYAQRYLLKPLKEDELYEAMDFAVANAFQTQMALHVKTADGIQQIFYRDIEYVENASRALHIFAADGTETVSRLLRKSFEDDIGSLLKSDSFIQPHKSFIVNLAFISLYGTNQITMRSGTQIPISKSRKTEVKRAYLKYMCENY